MYKKQIIKLESEYADVDNQLQRESTPALIEQRRQILDRLRVLRRQQFEYENEYLDNSDDDR